MTDPGLVAGRSIERSRIVGLGIRQTQRANAPGVAVAVPEPASLALLSLGGLAMLRRR